MPAVIVFPPARHGPWTWGDHRPWGLGCFCSPDLRVDFYANLSAIITASGRAPVVPALGAAGHHAHSNTAFARPLGGLPSFRDLDPIGTQ